MRDRNDRVIKYIVAAGVIVLAIISLLWFAEKREKEEVNREINARLSGIAELVKERYPEVTDKDIMSLILSDSTASGDVLCQYGILEEDETAIKATDEIHNKYILIKMLVVFFMIAIFVVFVYYRNTSKNKEVEKIIHYIERINRGDYELDIDDNKEDTLSILRNEVYKTTVMLKEAEQNSLKDKLILKDSLSDISHQLKTPITSLMINIENLEEYPDLPAEQKKKLLKKAKHDVANISFMVQYILKLSKLDSNTIDYNNVETTLGEIVAAAVENVNALSDLMDIKVEIVSDENAIIICDKYWQTEAVTNILKNAIEHALSKVTISYEKNEVFSQIVVENDGEAISEEERKHIFERFYRGEKSSRDSVGIGLALSKSIVEHAGGYISVESSNDKINYYSEEQSQYTRFIIKYL